MDALEKLTLLAALALAVVYLWRGYTAARDETIRVLREENSILRAKLLERVDEHEKA